jgi:hypothetical protein
MTTTPERCGWRDLVPQLTPGQAHRLAELEARSTLTPEATGEALLRTARYWAENNCPQSFSDQRRAGGG